MKHLGPVLFFAGLLLWGWLFFRGCEHPACRVLGVYTHRVSDIREYRDYVTGADLYGRYRAASLRFECDALREQLAQGLCESMLNDPDLKLTGKVRDEVARLSLLGARSEGRELHLTNDMTVGSEGLDGWADQISQMVAKDPDDLQEAWAFAAIRRLFDKVVLHAGARVVEVPVAFDPRSRCDRPK